MVWLQREQETREKCHKTATERKENKETDRPREGKGRELKNKHCHNVRYGRVNYVLAKRLELLEEVTRLQKSLGVPGDVAYTCETAR